MNYKEESVELIKRYGWQDTPDMWAYNPNGDMWLNENECILCMYWDARHDELSVLIDNEENGIGANYFKVIDDEEFYDLLLKDIETYE